MGEWSDAFNAWWGTKDQTAPEGTRLLCRELWPTTEMARVLANGHHRIFFLPPSHQRRGGLGHVVKAVAHEKRAEVPLGVRDVGDDAYDATAEEADDKREHLSSDRQPEHRERRQLLLLVVLQNLRKTPKPGQGRGGEAGCWRLVRWAPPRGGAATGGKGLSAGPAPRDQPAQFERSLSACAGAQAPPSGGGGGGELAAAPGLEQGGRLHQSAAATLMMEVMRVICSARTVCP